MINYKIDSRYMKGSGYGSLGMTNKYYKDGYWYKQNCSGYEGKSEYLCSILLKNSNLTNYIEYEECLINEKPGCRSKNFTHAGEQFVTFHKLFKMTHGGELAHQIAVYGTVDDRIQYILDFIYSVTGLDCRQYLNDILYIDMLTLDVDRHFSNLAVIRAGNSWREAPLFDFGASFFSLQHVFKKEMTFDEKCKIMTPQPFSGSLEEQAFALGDCRIRLDYEQIEKDITEEETELKDMILYQMRKYEAIFKGDV